MWWVKDPDRLKQEVAAVEALCEQEAWLTAATPRMFKGLKFAYEFDVTVNGETYPFRLLYPAFFPETPPQVLPCDGQQVSGHPYGDGGELCLEYRSDNWDLSVTGAMMMASTYRLLSGERPAPDERSVVPSEHRLSLGQELRNRACRFLLSPALLRHVTELPAGSCRDGRVVEITAPRKTWTTHVATLGLVEAPEWRETSIPRIEEKTEPCLLLRVESLADIPELPDQETLDRLIASVRGPHAPAAAIDPAYSRFLVVSDEASARMFWAPSTPARTEEAIEYMTSLFKPDDDEDRTGARG
jgi:hypothetical protein